jgi:hypothetical protein
METLSSYSGKGIDPFVTVRFNDNLTMDTIRSVSSSVLLPIDTPKGVRIEPPQEGRLYYRAFIPSEANRSRAKRPVHPWELHLQTKDGKTAATLVKIEEVWLDKEEKFELRTTPCAIPSTEQLKAEIEGNEPKVPVLLVFTEGGMTHGELMKWVRPGMGKRPIVHVYIGMPQD